MVHITINYMKKQVSELDQLALLSNSVGDFIRYWGFRRIHGQIWTQVYLSQIGLSGADLANRISVSKALISPALVELEQHGLITVALKNKKTKIYSAVEDVAGVIKNIIENREKKMIEQSHSLLINLKSASAKAKKSTIVTHRSDQLEQMIMFARLGLAFVLEQQQPG